MERAERDAFQASLRRVLESSGGAQVEAALFELGWLDALATDEEVAISLLFELQGSSLSSTSALERIVGGHLGWEVTPSTGLVLPALGEWNPPGHQARGEVLIRGLGLPTLATRESAWVVVATEGSEAASRVPIAELTLRPIRGMDADLGLIEVTGTLAESALRPESLSQTWSSSVALAHLALGYELVGAARQMLELARLHALERVQFGQPISQFQAIRHRLAETLVAIEAARAFLDAAWGERSSLTAGVAKSLAGRAAHTAARHSQQVLAGIGFTTEHEFHRYARRILVLDQLFGGSRSLTRKFGAELLEARELPAFAPL
jgi:hypothetical protein